MAPQVLQETFPLLHLPLYGLRRFPRTLSAALSQLESSRALRERDWPRD